MEFLKKHGEKVLFLVLVLGLALSVLFALNAKSNMRRTVQISSNAGKVNLSKDTSSIGELITGLTTSPMELAVSTDTFTPDVRVICMNPNDASLIPIDTKFCMYCGYEQTERVRDTDGDGINDSLEAKWGLDPNDPNDVFLDPDEDGFNTLVEFQQGTDPSDSLSFPPLIDYLRFKDVVETSIEFELRGIAKLGDIYKLQLYWKYPDENQGQIQYINEGETFGRNNDLLVESYTQKRPLIDGKYVEQSEAVIRSGSQKLTLMRSGDQKKGKITESSATLYLLMGPEWEKEIRVNQTIELDKKSYIIVDINTSTVVVKSDEPEATETISIFKAEPEELESVNPENPEDEMVNPNSDMEISFE